MSFHVTYVLPRDVCIKAKYTMLMSALHPMTMQYIFEGSTVMG